MAKKVVFMPAIAYALVERGFSILEVKENPKKPGRNCYVFEETPEFFIAFSEISSDYKSRRNKDERKNISKSLQ